MDQDPLIGRVIAQYRVLERLGEGGMGIVYLAEDTRLKRKVALKFIRTEAGAGAAESARFLREAQAAAALNHPHITTVHDVGLAQGRLFIAMEFLEGKTVRDEVAAGPLPLDKALDYALQAADGLRAAHEKGIVHRYIKSANLMVSPGGTLKIMDFGLARLDEGAESTRTGAVVGTVAYMSPEQASGEVVDQRTDIWALGVVLFEMVTGRRPFPAGNDRATLNAILTAQPLPVGRLRKGLPPELGRIIGRCLEKYPARRYPTAAALKADLDRLDQAVSGRTRTVEGGRLPRPGLSRLFKIRRRAYLVPLAVAGLALVTALVPGFRSLVGHWLGIGGRGDSTVQLAVLPFEVIGGDSSDRAFSAGLVEILANKLTQVERFQGALKVVPAVESRRLRQPTAGQARKAFRADRVISGSVQFIADRVIVTLNLIDADELRQLRSKDISVARSEWAGLPQLISADAVKMLDLEVGPRTQEAWRAADACRPEAASLYIQARGYLERYDNPTSVDISIDLLRKAIEMDGRCAVVFAVLGEAYWLKNSLRYDQALITLAEQAAQRAFELNPELAEVHLVRGVLHIANGRNAEAVSELELAARLDPLSAPVFRELGSAYEAQSRLKEAGSAYLRAIDLKPESWSGYQYLGIFDYRQGRFPEAERSFLRITELTPDNGVGHDLLGIVYLAERRYDRAISAFERSIALKATPEACSNLGTAYFYLGRYRDAADKYKQAIDLRGNDELSWGNLGDAYRRIPGLEAEARTAYARAAAIARDKLKLNARNGYMIMSLARYEALLGKKAEALTEIGRARALLADNSVVLETAVQVYELVGDRDRALEALAGLVEGGSAELIEANPDLAALRADPRYAKVMARKKPKPLGR